MHSTLTALVRQLQPLDELEATHIAATLDWIASDAPLFRIAKPATPPMHLVSYCVVLDVEHRQLLLVDHKNAGLWLPCGGHVEPDEHPLLTVSREIAEELGIEALLWQENPVFLTVTTTVGHDFGHTDVSLWYVVCADAATPLSFDPAEFHGIRWFDLDDLPERADPHLARFVAKLQSLLGVARGFPE